jgi:hypothetical protein
MLEFRNYFMKIMSKSAGPHLIATQGKLKTEREKIYIFLNFYCFSTPQPISVGDLC